MENKLPVVEKAQPLLGLDMADCRVVKRENVGEESKPLPISKVWSEMGGCMTASALRRAG